MLYLLFMFALTFSFQPAPAGTDSAPDVGGLRFQLRRLEERVESNANQIHELSVNSERRVTKLETEMNAIQKIIWIIIGALTVETLKRAYAFLARNKQGT